MNSRSSFIVACTVACLAAFAWVLVQARQLASLRTERQRLVSDSRPAEDTPNQSPLAQTIREPAEPRAAASPSLELLRLRSEVTRLTARRRELFDVTNESVRLRAQFQNRAANTPAATALPPGYVRKSEARFVGYNTPADTIQSLLWAVQNRDLTNMVGAFTAEEARQLQQQVQRSGGEEFFKELSIIPGMCIKSQQQMPDGSIELEVEIVPGEPMPERMRFRQINGQWKLVSL